MSLSSSLGSGIVSAGLQCGNTLCPTTSDVNLTEPVTVIIEHTDKVKVSNSHDIENDGNYGSLKCGIKEICP